MTWPLAARAQQGTMARVEHLDRRQQADEMAEENDKHVSSHRQRALAAVA